MANFSNQKNLLQRIKFNHYLVQCHNSKELKNFKHSTQTKKKQWNIHTESNDYEESDDNDERMDVAENYLKLKMNDVVCVSLAERKKNSFSDLNII